VKRFAATCTAGLLLGLLPTAAAAEVRIISPPPRAYTAERTITVMGLVTKTKDTSVAVKAGSRSYTFEVKDGYFFAGEVDLDDGLNTIQAGDKAAVSIFAGDDPKKAAAGYAFMTGHFSREDTCDSCHKAEEREDPADPVAVVLQEDTGTLCNWCHFGITRPKKQPAGWSLHKPTEEGKCLSCHDPHVLAGKALLKNEPKKLCEQCHQKLLEDIKTKPYVHGPINVATCDLCHGTHSSSEPFLLTKPELELCTLCHEKSSFMPKNAAVTGKHPGVEDGRCHQCHAAHASSTGRMMKKIVNNLCVECHPEKTSNFHEEKGFSIYVCGRCHDIHNPDAAHLINNDSKDLCLQCHENLGRGEFVHKPLAEKNCFECHQFHQKSMAKNQAEVCFRCHTRDERYDAAHPIKMDDARCTTCHAPHRSATKNLTYPVMHRPFAEKKCAACHDKLGGDQAGEEGAGDKLCFDCHPSFRVPESTAGIRIHKPFAKASCGSCHLVHNSDHPYLLTTDPIDLCGNCHSFVKKTKTFAPTSVHTAYKTGKCGDCHDTHIGRNEKLLKKPPTELCLGCHAKLFLAEDGTPFPNLHKPMKEGTCAQCHVGHFSKYPSLLREKAVSVCRNCHSGVIKAIEKSDNRSVHAPAKKGDCSTCHAAHGSPGANLMKKAGSALCRDCHPKLPLGNHHNYAPDRVTFAEGPLTGKVVECAECHRGHYSLSVKLLVKQDAPVCRQCHQM
jgi:predicted CXXCH cytochrome family protein